MKVEDALELVRIYDQYDFSIGILSRNAVFNPEDELNDFTKLDQCIEVIVLSHEINMSKSFANGEWWLSNIFHDAIEPFPNPWIKDFPFTESQIKTLVPVIARSFQDTVTRIMGNIDVTADDFPAKLLRQAASNARSARIEYPCVDHVWTSVYLLVAITYLALTAILCLLMVL